MREQSKTALGVELVFPDERPSYHNTLAHEGDQLRHYEQKAMTQDERILEAFYLIPSDCGRTPSDVGHYVLPNAPLTSVRRSMNTLTKQGKLIKTDEQRRGPYGRPETVWRLAAPVQTDLF